MDNRREKVLGLVVALLVAGVARADMVQVSERDSEREPLRHVCSRMGFQRADFSGLCDSSVAVGPDFGPVRFLPRAGVDGVVETSQTPYAMELTGRPGSSGICLYALMSLGLCSAPHWVKKLHFGHIPEWYHEGGPLQIGHSLAVNPDSVCPVPVCCFVQPVNTAADILAQYRSGTIMSLWRKSQFTPSVIASRGPPIIS